MNPLIQSKKTIIRPLLVALALTCLALPSASRALLPPPPPDGGYPGFNTAEGNFALYNRTTGSFNSAIGYLALFENTSGSSNTASGFTALFGNTTGENNTASGAKALQTNTEGSNNVAVGSQALFSNTSGGANTAIGVEALSNNTASINTATGWRALWQNTSGFANTADGNQALLSNTTASGNTATGFAALSSNTTGVENTAIGERALVSNIDGFSNTALGSRAGADVSTAHGVICIGSEITGENVSNSCYIGSIFGQTASGGTAVFINSSGKLGTTTSSRRFKEEIKAMGKASEALFALGPVTFRYKQEIDPNGTPQFGLVAEEVEKVNPDLIVRDKEGKPYSVRYDQVNAMLLNEFLKEHRKVQEQEASIAQLKSTVSRQQATATQQQKQIEVLTAGLQKVTDQLEANKPAPQMVLNRQ